MEAQFSRLLPNSCLFVSLVSPGFIRRSHFLSKRRFLYLLDYQGAALNLLIQVKLGKAEDAKVNRQLGNGARLDYVRRSIKHLIRTERDNSMQNSGNANTRHECVELPGRIVHPRNPLVFETLLGREQLPMRGSISASGVSPAWLDHSAAIHSTDALN